MTNEYVYLLGNVLRNRADIKSGLEKQHGWLFLHLKGLEHIILVRKVMI